MLVHDAYKIRYRFFQKRDNSVHYCGWYENNKTAREKRAGANWKRKNDARVVQTHVDLKNIKWAGLNSPTEV